MTKRIALSTRLKAWWHNVDDLEGFARHVEQHSGARQPIFWLAIGVTTTMYFFQQREQTTRINEAMSNVEVNRKCFYQRQFDTPHPMMPRGLHDGMIGYYNVEKETQLYRTVDERLAAPPRDEHKALLSKTVITPQMISDAKKLMEKHHNQL